MCVCVCMYDMYYIYVFIYGIQEKKYSLQYVSLEGFFS